MTLKKNSANITCPTTKSTHTQHRQTPGVSTRRENGNLKIKKKTQKKKKKQIKKNGGTIGGDPHVKGKRGVVRTPMKTSSIKKKNIKTI